MRRRPSSLLSSHTRGRRAALVLALVAGLLAPALVMAPASAAPVSAAAPRAVTPAAVTSPSSTLAEPGDEALAQDSLRRNLTKENFYFVMADRFANGSAANDEGGLTGDRLATGFDPTDKGFYHGGDLKGLLGKLDYIKGMGTTAIWMTPSFKNKPVQGSGANVSAGYHGYWITDFTQIDPHLGTNADLKALVDAAHAKGMKVFFDIITNHTADVIDYAEQQYTYRSKAAYPYVDADGVEFDDKAYAGKDTFPKVTVDSFPYTPVFRTPADATAKVPGWLNDRTLYHNRGDSTFAGENSEYGDFFGLDDLWTERPEVVRGMTDIYKTWVKDAGVDGFRIDTVKHVNMEFWQKFAPELTGYAAQLGNDKFFMFGEVFDGDPAFTSQYSTRGRLQATLDFPFQDAARNFASRSAATNGLRDVFAKDDYYTDADSNVYSSPTFLGNHDMGRIGSFVAADNPGTTAAADAEKLRRDTLAHDLMYFSRGMPVVYYGDEQGFTGKGGDKDARQDMFASRTPDYLTDDLLGTDATHAQDNYVTTHPLYREIGKLAALTREHPALRDGAQIHRLSSDAAGVYAFSRIDKNEQVEYVVALNNAETAQTAAIPTYSAGMAFTPIYPAAGEPVTSAADKTLTVSVPPLSAVVLEAADKIAAPAAGPAVSITAPPVDSTVRGRVEVGAEVQSDGFTQVTFAAKVGDGDWQVLGTDDNAPYRVFHDVSGVPAGTPVAYKAIAKDNAGHLASARTDATVGAEPPGPAPGAAKRDWLVVHYQRPAGDYDGWGLHAWGDIAEDVQWATPKPFAGEDSYGRFAWVKLAPGATNVGVIVHNGDTKDCATDRFVNPARTGEVWLKQGSCEVFTSQAAAQGFATVHYHRPDGTYAGWGLHLWGDAIADGVATEWTAPRQPDGTDAFGPFWRVPLKDAGKPLNFIIHNGDTKDPGPDQSFLPADGAGAWVNSGATTIHRTLAAAQNVAIIHYHRPDGQYAGWGLHAWTGSANPTEWTAPLQPAGTDAFGVFFRVPLAAGATSLSYIIHKGDQKDLPADQSLDLTQFGHEVWVQSGIEGYLLPMLGGAAADADLTKARAQWIDADTVAWNVKPSGALHYTLVYSPDGTLKVDGGVLSPGGRTLRLAWKPDGLTAAQKARWPHLASYAAFTVDPRDRARVREALRSQLIAIERTADGALLTATGVQIPGVLDDVYSGATTARLGPTFSGRTPSLALWAPTAQDVSLELYDDGAATTRPRVLPMSRDDATGVWRITGDPGWAGKYYLFRVKVWAPTVGQVVTNSVTDPYSLSLSTNSARSQIVDLADASLAPKDWAALRKPAAATPEQSSIYELHVRDFSIGDSTVPAAHRGTFEAFTDKDSAGMQHLRALAKAGTTYVHLLPAFDIATIEERRSAQQQPQCDLPSFAPDSDRQQACVMAVADKDGFNWGYDPLHYTAPEGSYATDPEGSRRVREFRDMVAGLNGAGLRVVMDVVYNHTPAAGQADTSVLDKVVPGYYQRLMEDGSVATSTCCANTAPEHAMMGKLVVDSVVTWAKAYKVDGFRFDLMGHHPKANILAVRAALDALTRAKDGVDGRSIYLYGEGWNFGEVANNARFEQATQANMAGTDIGTFNDRLRDAVRGGGPFDGNPRIQGFGSGLLTAPNGDAVNGTAAEQRARLLHYQDLIKVGLVGNLKDYAFVDSAGKRVTGAGVDYNGSPAGYTADPSEAITYVDAHDNETLYDTLAFKLAQKTAPADRARMQAVSLSTVALGQGVSFVHAGSELLRSKSLDRNSFNSGDWFNRLSWDCRAGNGFGSGLPPQRDNGDKWDFARPLLADPALRMGCPQIRATDAAWQDLLRVKHSSPLFALGSAAAIQQRVSFPLSGTAETPGVITMHLSDAVPGATDLDRRYESVTVIFNAGSTAATQTVAALRGTREQLHPVQAEGADAVVKQARFDRRTGTFTVPARTVAVFVQR